MELYDALLTTRAMRRYRDDPVTDDEIEHCLRAAQQAPSGGNLQPWQYLVVTDPVRRAGVGDLYRSAYDRYERTLLAITPLSDARKTRRRGDARPTRLDTSPTTSARRPRSSCSSSR
jgi:nitroreductase